MRSVSNNYAKNLFSVIRAEDSPWIHHVFVPLPFFSEISSDRSVVVVGKYGSGKTTLGIALRDIASEKKSLGSIFLVNWRPVVHQENLSQTSLFNFYIRQLFDSYALSLLDYLGAHPKDVLSLPTWAQEVAVWFVNEYLQGNVNSRLYRVAVFGSDEAMEIMRDLFTKKPNQILSSSAQPVQVLDELQILLEHLGFTKIWVVVDELEPWMYTSREMLQAALTNIFSTMFLFEQSRTQSFKIILPIEMAPSINSANPTLKNRIEVRNLDWKVDELIQLIERRLSFSKNKNFSLRDLCSDEKYIVGLLKKYGGDTPRGWIGVIRPIITSYIDNERNSPFTPDEVTQLVLRYPPRFGYDQENGVFLVGEHEVFLPPNTSKIILYLMTHPERKVFTKSQLYYLAYRGLSKEPISPDDPEWELPATYEGIIDTALWRLRQAIEIDPERPVYISSEGKLIRLANAENILTPYSEKNRLRIFLCYSSDDKSQVYSLYQKLSIAGHSPWMDDEDLLPGADWDLEIHKQVRECDVVMVCISESSVNKRGYVQKEIKYALDVADEQPEGAIYIVPTRLEVCEVPDRLTRWQWVNLFEEDGFEKLIATLRNVRANKRT